ncbi:two-component system regulatory protein YycI [Halobacillus litoralis]|uniref:two-component system regulatory protein YycI n=1 Tax=Halobacillus litoralis TaxID=45668 RepID=UPI00249333BE|nr:two-component system regulatory protein YycI [Halobacillus litoralis]
MQWGQIKILFILSFLVLDLFLLQQFLSKQSEDELGQISTVAEDIETALENNDITIAEDAIPEVTEVAGLKSKEGGFSEDILSQIEEIDDSEQQVEVENDRVLKVTLDEPVEVNEDNIINKVNSIVPFGAQYSYWGWNEEEGTALFFQIANDRTVYFNEGGYLLVNIADGEITGYVATLLNFSDTEEDTAVSSPEQIIAPLSAINTLYTAGYIEEGDEVTSMSVGYHSSFNLVPGEENGPQVFAPTWKVTVNDEKNLFLYAISGTFIESDETGFIEDLVGKYDVIQGEVESDTTEENETSETN